MTTPAWSERVTPDESARFERMAAQLRAIQHKRNAGGPPRRGLHAKAVAAATGTLTPAADLPAWAAVGVFAQPEPVRALVRFSNGSGAAQADPVPDVRGLAVKLVGVPGKKLIPGLQDAMTQDFLAILTQTMPFETPDAFVGLVRALAGPKILALPRLILALGLKNFGPTLKTLQAGLARPVPSLAEVPFYTPTPIRWGDAAVKFMFEPLPSPAPSGLVQADHPERLGLDLAARLRAGPLAWAMKVQPWVDEARTPIEDVRVLWDPAVSLWVTVARLELPQQDLSSPAAQDRAARVERLSFDPWHAPEAFRPLGAMMRARGPAYRESVLERGTDAEPTGQEAWLTG